MAAVEYTRRTWPRDRWPHFSYEEMACRHTGQLRVDGSFMDRLERLRCLHGRPVHVTSGYRHETHPIEQAKRRPGAHTLGLAVDVRAYGDEAYALLSLALGLGFRGIGIQQSPLVRPRSRFLHLDLLPVSNDLGVTRPWLWSYPVHA